MNMRSIKNNLPHSYGAEQGVLGGLILNNACWEEVTQLVSASDFYYPAHGVIYLAIARLAEKNSPFDLLTLSDSLQKQEQMEMTGGFAYVAELVNNTPSAANIMAYAQIVAKKSRLRQLVTLGQTLMTSATDSHAEPSTLINQLESELFALAEKQLTHQSQEMTTGAAISQLVDYLEQVNNSQGISGIPTGFKELDKLTCGLQSGELILLAARPAMGKTALALTIALAVLQRCQQTLCQQTPCQPTLCKQQSVQIFSIEMPATQLMLRLLAMMGNIELSHLRGGTLEDREWARVADCVNKMSDWSSRLVVDDNSLQTPALLRTRARRYLRKYGKPALIVVDYLQLIRSPGQENRTQEIADISRSLKALAKELDCPVLALSQLNRAVELRPDKRPNSSDLRDSGALEQDADLILFIYRDEVYHPDGLNLGQAEIIIGKQRQGATGSVLVQFDGKQTHFSDYPQGAPTPGNGKERS